MATDQALLDLAEQSGEGFLRLYRWAPFCLSFGRHEPALRRYNRAEIEKRGIDVVRRPTGGRAVWHARELTYAVAAPIEWFGTLPETYRSIHAILARALRQLGVDATLAAPAPAPGFASGPCFASAAGGEVLAGGRKLLGSAQLRQGTAFLQHGSLLLEDNQDLVSALTLGPTAPSDEITLHEAAGRQVTFDEAASSVVEAFQQSGGAWQQGAPTLDQSHCTQFRDADWTWRR